MKLSKLFATGFTAVAFTFMFGYMMAVTLSDFGVPYIITSLISIFIGFKMPSIIFNWVLKEELEELRSAQNEEEK